LSDILEIKVKGAERTHEAMSRLAKKINDFRPVFKQFVPVYQSEVIQKAFDTRGAIFGKKWASYNPEYLSWKQKHYPGRQMLVLTGHLKAAAQGGSGWKQKISKKKLIMGVTGKDYFYYVQQGYTSRGGNNIEPRMYLHTNKEGHQAMPTRAQNILKGLMEKHIERLVNG
jgi:phage gpG-like protein